MLRTTILAVAALMAAAPAIAGYHYVTIDAPAAGVLGTVVTAINDNRVAAGYYVTYDPGVPAGALGDYTGFTVNADGSGFTSFIRPGYAQTGAAGINDAGDIAGVSVDAMNHGVGFVRSGLDGSYVDIDPNLGGIASLYSEAIGINNLGAVTGFYITDPAADLGNLTQFAHGFIDFGGVYSTVDIDPSLGYGTQIVAINDLGLFVGSFYDNSPDHNSHAFVGGYDFATHTPAILGVVPELFGSPSSSLGNISDNFNFVYNAVFPNPMSPVGFVSAAFVGNLVSGSLAPIAPPGAIFTNGFGVNDLADVTGFYVSPTGLHGFIASVVPEPATWSLMLAGFGLAGAALRRRPALA